MKRRFKKRVLLIGNDNSNLEFIQWNRDQQLSEYHITGILSWKPEDEIADRNLLQLGSIDDIERIALAHKVDEIIFPFEKIGKKAILNTLFNCRALHTQYKFTAGNDRQFLGMPPANLITGVPLVDFNPAVYTDFNIYIKRLFDIVVSFILLPVLLLLKVKALFSRSYSLEKIEISDGNRSFLKTSFFQYKGEKLGGWKAYLPLLIEVIRGTATICGSQILMYRDSKQGSGYKPGLTSILDNAAISDSSSEGKERILFDYLNHYSVLLDFKLLMGMFRKHSENQERGASNG